MDKAGRRWRRTRSIGIPPTWVHRKTDLFVLPGQGARAGTS